MLIVIRRRIHSVISFISKPMQPLREDNDNAYAEALSRNEIYIKLMNKKHEEIHKAAADIISGFKEEMENNILNKILDIVRTRLREHVDKKLNEFHTKYDSLNADLHNHLQTCLQTCIINVNGVFKPVIKP